jgi:signal transduction histidine kinase
MPSQLSSAEGPTVYDRCLLTADHELSRGLVEAFNHHARTPLAVILGHVELLTGEEDELPAEMQHSLAAMFRAGQRLNDVVAGICDLIDVASLDPTRLIMLDLTTLVDEEIARCRDRAAQRELRVVATGDPVRLCVADPRRVRRAIAELLDNALTYAPDDSTVRVASTTAATGVRVTISDQGDGVDPADRERLTRPFERGNHPRQPMAGRGMGLALASAVAASHRGRLILSESLGGGLQASLELPLGFAHPSEPVSGLRTRTRRTGSAGGRATFSMEEGDGGDR